ncbi:hypothetical protein [Hymenobacter wooponensis]|nr:hypothetical protein [Hymenobacter wooponensis]
MLGAAGRAAHWNHNNVFVWDVGGYYSYLPATFLTNDLGDGSFLRMARHNYRPDMDPEYGFIRLPNSRMVFKYPIGMAVAYSPFFWLTNFIYKIKGRPVTTGYEHMYQYMISLGCMGYVLAGLALLGLEIRRFFSDSVAAVTLLIIALCTNLFTYAVYEPLMAHGTLFLLTVLLLRTTRQWYEQATHWGALSLGLVIGILLLIRPSELLLLLVPVLWGLTCRAATITRLRFWAQHWRHIVLGVIVVGLIGSLQLIFWRVVGGQWFVPFYPGETFHFDQPHVWEGLFSVKKGWLLYSPLLALGLLGVAWVRQWAAPMLPIMIVLIPIYIYCTFCWWDWGYGGSYGGRALISLYPILAFGMASFLQRWLHSRNYGLLTALTPLILLGLLQNYQYSIGLINCCTMTWETYKQFFLQLDWPRENG